MGYAIDRPMAEKRLRLLARLERAQTAVSIRREEEARHWWDKAEATGRQAAAIRHAIDVADGKAIHITAPGRP